MTTIDQRWEQVYDLFKMRHYYILFTALLIFIAISYFEIKIGKEAYFYTLSTISQTLAALIGIIAIFVIFKLDRLKTERSDSFKRLKKLLDTDIVNSVPHNPNKKQHDKIYRIIKTYEDDYIVDDEVLNNLSYTIENFDFNGPHTDEIKIFIRKLKILVTNVSKIDEYIKTIVQKFSNLTIVVFIPIILSILALPFGWFIVPIGILPNLSILKLPLVVSIVYLTILSIFQTKQFLDYAINSSN